MLAAFHRLFKVGWLAAYAGSDKVNHCYMKWVRSMASRANGGRPFLPSG